MDEPFDVASVQVTLVAAASADGKISTRDGAGPRFASARDKALLRRLRGETDAVVLGAGTVANDDPAFRLRETVRAERRKRGQWETPIRAVISGRASVSPEARLFHGHRSPSVVFVAEGADEGRRAALASVAAVYICERERVDVREMVAVLGREYGVRRLLVEGGAEVNASFVEAGLVDEVYLTVCPVLIGGAQVPTPVGGHGLEFERILRLLLLEVRAEDGEVFLHYRVER
jgi:riboflavin-specific deaminase-like protein